MIMRVLQHQGWLWFEMPDITGPRAGVSTGAEPLARLAAPGLELAVHAEDVVARAAQHHHAAATLGQAAHVVWHHPAAGQG